MTASSPDQQGGAPASQQHTGKRRLWVSLLTSIGIFFYVAVIVLGLLVLFKVIPVQWFAPLSVLFGSVLGFVKTTLSDKDFQDALRKRLTKVVAGDDEKKGDEATKNAAPNITINFTPNITNTNTNTAAPAPNVPAIAAPPAPAQPALQHPVTGTTTTNQPHVESVFLVGAPLPTLGEYFGRFAERTTLFDRTHKGYSTSIVGSRRIGKTWLISFLQFALADEFGARCRIGYIDAARPSCVTPAGFTACALEALGMPVLDEIRAHLSLALLEKAIANLRTKQEIPVLCIDEFEAFGKNAVFDLQFLSELRRLAGPGLGLCFVIASKTPLIDIVGDIGKTSGFYNIFEQLTLRPFNSEEADEFIDTKGAQAGFNDQERDYLRTNGREYGPKGAQWPPLRLQIAGSVLERDKKLAAAGHPEHYRPSDIAYWKEFEEQLNEKYRGMVKV